jgi:uncharacterized sodium:solute symporter family permease YidK
MILRKISLSVVLFVFILGIIWCGFSILNSVKAINIQQSINHKGLLKKKP